MPGLAELAAVMMTGAERRIEVTAANVSNLNTPGYRTRRIFIELIDSRSAKPVSREVLARSFRNAALLETSNALDLATDANSVLALRSGDSTFFARSAQLHRAPDGRLLDTQGRALLSADGGDLVVSSGLPEILPDGLVLIGGQPEGRVGLFDGQTANSIGDLGASASTGGSVWQRRLVASDVELGDEMLELNKASRMAETGARLLQLQDDLLARTANQMGSIGR